MKSIELTQGFATLVDDEDYDFLNKCKWQVQTSTYTNYARTYKKHEYMHRMITGASKGKIVDHIDGNGLNNTRKNLRIVTQRENILNRHRLSKNNTSGVTGVSWYVRTNKWRVHAKVNSRDVHIGYFDNKQKAEAAYKRFYENLAKGEGLKLPHLD